MTKAVARLGDIQPKFRSKLEKRAWDRYYEWCPDFDKVYKILYEPLMIRMSGGNYTPDFLIVYKDGSMTFIEVKGSWTAYKSARSSKRSLKQAAVEYAWLADWYALLPDGRDGWDLQKFGE